MIPEWLVCTVMILKEGCKGKAHQYRPITCLNTMYKLLTGTLIRSRKEIVPDEQKGVRRHHRDRPGRTSHDC